MATIHIITETEQNNFVFLNLRRGQKMYQKKNNFYYNFYAKNIWQRSKALGLVAKKVDENTNS